MSFDLKNTLKKAGIVPVAAFDTVEDALKTAEILMANSIDLLEITVRTDVAFECMEKVKNEIPEMQVGAGSVLSMDSMKKSIDCGAEFLVAPGYDPELVDYACSEKIAFVPGIATPSELNAAVKKFDILKVFPASVLGGVNYLKAISAPFSLSGVNLLPTGGINETNYLDYLALDNVIACGMSYIVDKKLINRGEFSNLDKRIKKIVSGLKS